MTDVLCGGHGADVLQSGERCAGGGCGTFGEESRSRQAVDSSFRVGEKAATAFSCSRCLMIELFAICTLLPLSGEGGLQVYVDG